MENTLDSIQPSDQENTRDNMSYLYGRDPSILAYGNRPIPSSQQNLISLFGDEEEAYTDDIGSDASTLQTIKVYLRVKPLPRKLKLTKEEAEAYQIANSTTLVTKLPNIDHNSSSLKGSKPAATICRKFTFTKTFGPETTQLYLFEQVVQQKMVDFLAGHNSTIMTYGTTNSGKSYTLQGTTTSPGIIPRGLEFVFSNITARPTPLYKPLHNNDVVSLNAVDRAQELECKNKLLTFGSLDKHHYINAYKQMQKLLHEESPIRPSQACDAQYSVWVSFAEIYNENVYDLLSNECQKRRPLLKLGTDGHGRAFIKGLKEICVNSGSEAYQVLMAGQYNLKVAATALNARSSRSHCIFSIKLLKYYVENSPDRVEVSTFSFCDLAGSERLKKTLNVGDRLKEAQNINTSLLVLGRCLKSIYEGQNVKKKSINEHVGPFRESKLTRLFQQALSGKEQIVLIVNVNPVPNLYAETQNVLNFSAIAKEIIVETKLLKRRMSNSRFSQIVAQSVRSCTDWDETDLPEITEQTTESCTDVSIFIHQDEFDDVIAENKSLKREIKALKASILQRDLQVRQELADTYTSMMQKLETDWKNRIRDVEEQQEDQLAWSVNRVETFYQQKISELNSRKRRRRSGDIEDSSDGERHNLGELEIENSRITDEIDSLKKKLETLRKNNEDANVEKNKVGFELGLVNAELQSVKSLLSAAEADLSADDEELVYIKTLRTELSEKQAHIKKLKTFLDEAKNDYISITDHAREMESRLKDQAEELAESEERAADLEELLEQVKVCLAEKTKTTEVLEEKINIQSNLLRDAKLSQQNTETKLIDAEETIRQLRDKLAILEKTNSVPKSVTPDSMLADVEIKEELLSESESEISLDNPKTVLHPEIVIKTDNEILGIPVTSYDNDRDSEMFVELQEISEKEESDEIESVKKFKIQLLDSKMENEKLKRKCEQNHVEIDSLRESFEAVKNQLADVNKQLNDYKITTAMENEMKKVEKSFLMQTSTYEANEVQTMENECQTASISGQDQNNQTSFVEPDCVDKSMQAEIFEDEEFVAIQKRLEVLSIKCDHIEADCEKKDELIASLRTQLENHVSADELDKLKTKYEQLKVESEKKEQAIVRLKEQLENRISEEELEKIRIKNDQLEAECKKNETVMAKLKEQLEDQTTKEVSELLKAKYNQLESEYKEKQILMEKLEEELKNVRESSKSLQEKSNEDLRSLEKALATAVAEKEDSVKTLAETKELLEKLESQNCKCRDEYKLKITTLENELTETKEREETKSKCIKEQNDKIAEVEIEIKELEKRCQLAAKKDKEKDEEIKQLQKALKKHLVVEEKTKMDETMEEKLKELKETTEALERLQESYDRLRTTSMKDQNALENEIALLKQNARSLEKSKKEAEETNRDICRIKTENEELKALINDKDREMESFMKNRDEMIVKFENLIQEKQEELERANREITKLQENLHRTITPRDKGTKPADEAVKFPIPVVDLSDSETKRITRRTALAPPSNVPKSDGKKSTRRRRLYQPVDDSCVDLENNDAVPPSPSTSRTLRNRKK